MPAGRIAEAVPALTQALDQTTAAGILTPPGAGTSRLMRRLAAILPGNPLVVSLAATSTHRSASPPPWSPTGAIAVASAPPSQCALAMVVMTLPSEEGVIYL
jgi:hypothetical protein